MPIPSKRLPEVRPLTSILPKGAEGGKEFGRIMDLLLFQEARRQGHKFTIFNDAAGDYGGLDSFAGDSFRRTGTTGYQYKFFTTPLSSKHRFEIKRSLSIAIENSERTKLKKWILVLPEDLTESATRKGGGDVSWIEAMQREVGDQIELECWGHTKILSLFLETPSLCLFYYPELVDSGASQRRTLQETRLHYDNNLRQKHGRIEFIGMSVYKEEATRGVPMEDIYIPLSIAPESAEELGEHALRAGTLSLLERGRRHVVLGDPGSGKSTLLKCLAMVGISDSLQQRCKATPDNRLAILITLRRYADELKTRRNLSLLDYIVESTQADFSIPAAKQGFFEYYLETGQAILLFDGLDELPNPAFKEVVRDRIQAMTTSHPGNTVVVTSRIIGYESALRFDDKLFRHCKLAKLRVAEIEQFIQDWYRIRVENASEREQNIKDLVRIIADPEHLAIRELAENPLLLTIVALVHRIDAVLPDERVVLYQKCTETLLNTWHKWKFREEGKPAGKVERRNHRRVEAIAYWMQCRSGSVAAGQRAVVPLSELRRFLARFIKQNESARDRTGEPEDLADEFLEFIRKRAGLLIKAGDQRFSFVHLTFQEYLSSTHIAAISETGGFRSIWKHLAPHVDDPRWREVIRLLAAGLRSESSQKQLLLQLHKTSTGPSAVSRALLLGGLLLDGIGPAEEKDYEVIGRLIFEGIKTEDPETLRSMLAMIRAWQQKGPPNANVIRRVLLDAPPEEEDSKRRLALICHALHMPDEASRLVPIGQLPWMDILLTNQVHSYEYPPDVYLSLDTLEAIHDWLSVDTPFGNFIAAAGVAVRALVKPESVPQRLFHQQLVVLSQEGFGPYSHLLRTQQLLGTKNYAAKASGVAPTNSDGLDASDLCHALTHLRRSANGQHASPRTLRAHAISVLRTAERTLPTFDRHLRVRTSVDRAIDTGADIWDAALSDSRIPDFFVEVLFESLNLRPRPQWRAALSAGFLPELPSYLARYFTASYWGEIVNRFRTQSHWDPLRELSKRIGNLAGGLERHWGS